MNGRFLLHLYVVLALLLALALREGVIDIRSRAPFRTAAAFQSDEHRSTDNHSTYQEEEDKDDDEERIDEFSNNSTDLIESHWADLNDKAQRAATLLGFTEELWDNNSSVPMLRRRPQNLGLESHFNVSGANVMRMGCWNDIDLTAPPDGCGNYKCFFRSCSNAQIGYIVSYAIHDSGSVEMLPMLTFAWKVAQRLPHNARTNLIEPPEKIRVPSQAVISSLRSLVYYAQTQRPDIFVPPGTRWLNEEKPREIVVQKTKRIPRPNIVLKCYILGSSLAWRKRVASFAAGVQDKETFARRYIKDLDLLANVVMVQEPSLWNDFQIMVDSRGQIHYIDLDRIDKKAPWNPVDRVHANPLWQETCVDHLRHIENSILFGAPAPEMPLDYKNMYWADLNDTALRAAKLLGFNEDLWDNDKHIHIYSAPFEALDTEQKNAVVFLGLESYFDK